MPLSIGVLVDLERNAGAGGHVKSWERLAEAAVDLPGQLDLTVHFLGREHQVIPLAEHVRYVLHPPVWGTERLPFLDQVSGQTDLAAHNRKLLPFLQTCDVIHATHPLFAFGRTAMRYAQRSRTPLVSSIHTDTVKHGQICVADVIRRLTGRGAVSRLLNENAALPARWAASTHRKLLRYWGQCDRVLVSQADDFQHVAQVLPKSRISYLRRGLNRHLFNPHERDRELLHATFGAPQHKFLVLFVGRLDATTPLAIMALGVLPLALTEFFVNATLGRRRMEAQVGVRDALVPLSMVGAAIVLHAMGWRKTGLAWAFVISHTLGAIAAIGAFQRLFGDVRLHAAANEPLPLDLRGYARPIWAAELSNTLLRRLDPMILAVFADAFTVGVYGVVLQFANTVSSLRSAFDALVTAMVADVSAGGRQMARARERLRHGFSDATSLVIMTQLPVIAFFITFGPWLLALFGDGFE